MYTIPMGSSNMGIMTIGDIEAQQHYPKWFVDHKYMLRPNQEDEMVRLGFDILKVPEHSRQPPSAFSPQGWRFGLHNRENLENRGSEALKLTTAVQYGLVGEKWDRFCHAIVDDPRAMFLCYGLKDGMNSWTNEQIQHVLALDALFLAIYIDISIPTNERRLWGWNTLFGSRFHENDVFQARFRMCMSIMPHDLRLVENQIPLIFIDKVVEYMSYFVASETFEGNEPLTGDLQYQQKCIEYVVENVANAFMDTSHEAFKIDYSNSFNEKTHILGATYNAICGSKGSIMKSMWRSEYFHVPSARVLDHSGIKIFGVDGPLCTMSYKEKCLFLPKMRIVDGTSSFIQNMAWYESRSDLDDCLFHDYIFFMIDLIQTYEDFNLLIEHGVIYNGYGIKGFEMWIALEEGLNQIPSSQSHHDMKVAIVSRCELRSSRLWTILSPLWSEFKIVFCSKPWLVLSTIAVVLVTVATLVQTYIAIIGSNKMKPKFP